MRPQLLPQLSTTLPQRCIVIHQQVRLFAISNPRNDIRFPHGVPAFPVSPQKSQTGRPLPAYKDVRTNTTRNIVIFLSICGAWTIASLLAINYERFVSPITASTLHEVRKSPEAAVLLGTDIQHKIMHPAYRGWSRYDGWFRQPWISGSIQLTKGRIDIAYDVKGSGIIFLQNSADWQLRRAVCILSVQEQTNSQNGELLNGLSNRIQTERWCLYWMKTMEFLFPMMVPSQIRDSYYMYIILCNQ
jgi:hypothetical protein